MAHQDTHKTLLETSPISHAVLSIDGRVEYANAALVHLIGSGPASLMSTPFCDFFDKECEDKLRRAIAGATDVNEPQTLEAQLPHLDGSSRQVLITLAHAADASPPGHIVLHVEDITRLRRKERVQEVFRTLAEKLMEASTPVDVAQNVVNAADALFRWNCGFVSLYSPLTGEYEALITIDEEDNRRVIYPPTVTKPMPGSNTERALNEGAALILRTPETSPETHGIAFGSGRPSASLMYVPMRRRGRNAGLVSIQSYHHNAFTPDDLQVLQQIADFSSTAAERTYAEKKAAETEAALKGKEKRLELVMLATNDAIYDYDIITGNVWWNDGALNAFDPDTGSGSVESWVNAIHPEDRPRILSNLEAAWKKQEQSWTGEYRFRLNDGTYGSFLDRGYVLYEDSKPVRMIGSMMDVTRQKHTEELLRHGAYHDSLTQLPNRAHVIAELTRSLARIQRHPGLRTGVLFLDLDRFKGVNDGLGHAAGDDLLVEVARALRKMVRPSDLVGRLSGDEFVIMLEDIADEHDAIHVAERVIQRLQEPFIIGKSEIYTGTSIGITISSERYTSAEEMLRDADTAMYRAKTGGKGRFEIFDQEMHTKVLAQVQTEYDLRRAVQQQQFVLHYQGIFDLRDSRLLAYEALVRWNHPQQGLVGPGNFIEIAEETGIIVSLGEWVLQQACQDAMTWNAQASGPDPLSVHVNVSARQFSSPGFADIVSSILSATGLEPERLALEITESMLLAESSQRADEFERLRRLGVKFHLDDFGTGYSSLSYLHQYPIDGLKIDRSFIQRFESDVTSREIVRAIISMARIFNLSVVAEGIETPAQASLLQDLGCWMAQGYLLHRPQRLT